MKKKDEASSSSQNQRKKNPIISMIIIIEIKEKEEEEEGKDLEEEVSMENVFTVEKKGIENLSVPNVKEGMVEELKTRIELHMLMKIPNPHILKMLKEDKS